MSIEFTRGPNVYLRELVPADLENIKNSLVDWEQFPFSIDKTKNYLKRTVNDFKIHRKTIY